ncbi:MAG: 30S ribosome-binding factor RbfA [Desulfobacteraceae bacterium]|nr:30S ribosome-binding factor RbfA [Desulfobacteraceae bacterium]
MKPFSRADRVAGHIQRALSAILIKETSDPRIGTATITRVRVSADLRLARVYFAVHADTVDRQAAVDGFRNARAFLKRRLAPELTLRYMPELEFFYDDTFDQAARINQILKTLQQDHAVDHPPVDPE